MKEVLDDKCRRCGGQVWYVFKSGRRCVDCAHAQSLLSRREIRSLQARVQTLEALLDETVPHIDAGAVGHDSVLGSRFDCNCLLCRVVEAAIRGVSYQSAGQNTTNWQRT